MSEIEVVDECNALSRRVEMPQGRILVEASTLGEALEQIEQLLGVRFSLFQGYESFSRDQYFVVDPPIPEPPVSIRGRFRQLMLAIGARPHPWEVPCLPKNCVDIHILRGREVICPKQDLSFEILNGDKLVFPRLIC